MISDSTKYCRIQENQKTEEWEDAISEIFCVFEVATGQSNLTSNFKINLKYACCEFCSLDLLIIKT